MQPTDIQIIGTTLAIKWNDQTETLIPLQTLRQHCPCASCQGEKDILGNHHKPPTQPTPPNAHQITQIQQIGNYALRPTWADGHQTGLYTYQHLRQLADPTP